jgi:hypothetical protein
MKPHTENSDPGILKETAVAVGGAAGKVAALAKSILPHHDKPAAAAKTRIGKLAPQNKTRVPRKQKKAMARKAKALKPAHRDM